MAYVGDAGYTSVADNAHDYPLQLAATTGVPGAAMFCGIFVWAGSQVGPHGVRQISEIPVRLLQGAFWAPLPAICASSWSGCRPSATRFLLWLAIGVLLAPSARLIRRQAPLRTAGLGHGRLVALAGPGHRASGAADRRRSLLPRVANGRDGSGSHGRRSHGGEAEPVPGDYKIEVAQAHSREFRAALEGYLAASAARRRSQRIPGDLQRQVRPRQSGVPGRPSMPSPDAYNYYLGLIDLYNLAGQASDAEYLRGGRSAVARKALEARAARPRDPSASCACAARTEGDGRGRSGARVRRQARPRLRSGGGLARAGVRARRPP